MVIDPKLPDQVRHHLGRKDERRDITLFYTLLLSYEQVTEELAEVRRTLAHYDAQVATKLSQLVMNALEKVR